MNKPLKEISRADRERAIDLSRGPLLERYYRLREELEEVRKHITTLDAQKIVLQGLELPVQEADATE